MQTENKSISSRVMTVSASDFVRALLSLASSITAEAEMQDVKISYDGSVITALVDDARITIAPRQGKEGGAA